MAICALRDQHPRTLMCASWFTTGIPKSMGLQGGVPDLYYAFFHVFRHALRSPGEIFSSTYKSKKHPWTESWRGTRCFVDLFLQ
jgi:hypothetical protein